MKNKNSKIIALVAGVTILFTMVSVIIGIAVKKTVSLEGKTLDELVNNITVTNATPTKGTVQLDDNTLYDELPEIDKYPLQVTGNGDVNIEIFSSGEKAGSNTDGFLVDVAEKFNNSGITLSNGKSVSISVRSVTSGLGADYIASGKYTPDLYCPSNTLFGDYAVANGASLDTVADRVVGNTAGILVKKGSGYSDLKSIITDVQNGKLNLGYTNPQTSATGLNLLLEILKEFDSSNMFSQTATKAFSDFNSNIPYVAYTTQQMRDSASNGSLDAMVSEYQAYINDKNLTSVYDFIPFGIRHDNPLYLVNKSSKTADQIEAVNLIKDYLLGTEAQSVATADGFNAEDKYKSSYTSSGSEVTQALKIYKTYKDSGRDIIAVFVADCSGSMDGEPMLQLKNSLSNGAKYINDNNYIGLVSYSNDVTIELPIAQFDFNQRSYFQGAVDSIYANGGTASYDAIIVAMQMIEQQKESHPDAKCMIILLSDGYANVGYSLEGIKGIISEHQTPIYTISYGDSADTDQLGKLSQINEAASINADSEDIVYKIKSLFNSQL